MEQTNTALRASQRTCSTFSPPQATTATETISALAIGPDDSYVVILNQNDYRTAGVPGSLTTYLQSAAGSGLAITRVALGTNGSWVVVTQSTQANAQTNTITSSGIPDAFTGNLSTIKASQGLVTGVRPRRSGQLRCHLQP